MRGKKDKTFNIKFTNQDIKMVYDNLIEEDGYVDLIKVIYFNQNGELDITIEKPEIEYMLSHIITENVVKRLQGKSYPIFLYDDFNYHDIFKQYTPFDVLEIETILELYYLVFKTATDRDIILKNRYNLNNRTFVRSEYRYMSRFLYDVYLDGKKLTSNRLKTITNNVAFNIISDKVLLNKFTSKLLTIHVIDPNNSYSNIIESVDNGVFISYDQVTDTIYDIINNMTIVKESVFDKYKNGKLKPTKKNQKLIIKDVLEFLDNTIHNMVLMTKEHLKMTENAKLFDDNENND